MWDRLPGYLSTFGSSFQLFGFLMSVQGAKNSGAVSEKWSAALFQSSADSSTRLLVLAADEVSHILRCLVLFYFQETPIQ